MTRRARTALALAFLAPLLAGCFATPDYRPVGYVTPKDPPPLPQRKPAPPADLAAWQAPLETAAALAPSDAVEVQQLAPQDVSQQSLALPAPRPSPMVQQAAAQLTGAPTAADGTYVVAKGDSLYGIARRFGLPIRAVIDANDLQPPYALSLGQSLTIPRAEVHEVASGDTVFNIAQRYGVDRSELVRLNGIQAPYSIPVGQKLILPTPGAAGPMAAQATSVAYTPADQPIEAIEPPAAEAVAVAPDAAAPQPEAPAAGPARSPAAVRAALAHLPARASSSFLWPIQGQVLSSFGAKEGGEHNDGINIAAPRGTPVRAAENGVVAYAGEELKGFGRLLLVKHADGWVTAYAHNEELLVTAGDAVKRGETIARVGSSGNVQRPQLHFEVRRGTRAVNPETELAPRTAAVVN